MNDWTQDLADRLHLRLPLQVCLFALLLCAATQAVSQTIEADPLDNWQVRHPLPPGIALNGNTVTIALADATRFYRLRKQ
ncbi:MAG: hypothetical protein FJ398_20085 [Verrucomicrobia bacterium]|nr:hypothetical protein [Verrucomicrobiota bacterium]